MSLNCPFLLSPFFFLSFSFYLRKYLGRWAEACNKVHSLIYCWWNRILSVSLFLFWIQIIPIFRKGRRKNSLSCTYLWQGLIFRLLSLAECEHVFLTLTSVQRFCFTLFTGDSPELVKLASIFRQCLSRTSRSLTVNRCLRRLMSSNWRSFSKFL